MEVRWRNPWGGDERMKGMERCFEVSVGKVIFRFRGSSPYLDL